MWNSGTAGGDDQGVATVAPAPAVPVAATPGLSAELQQTIRALPDQPVVEHPEVFDRAYAELAAALRETDGA